MNIPVHKDVHLTNKVSAFLITACPKKYDNEITKHSFRFAALLEK